MSGQLTVADLKPGDHIAYAIGYADGYRTAVEDTWRADQADPTTHIIIAGAIHELDRAARRARADAGYIGIGGAPRNPANDRRAA